MSAQLFNNPKGFRGDQDLAGLKMHELYKIIYDRLEYIRIQPPGAYAKYPLDRYIDLDAVCQNTCCEVEKKLGIYPNIKDD